MSSDLAMVEDSILIQRVDATLAAAIDARGLPASLAEAMTYAALGPGKRVRPVLVYRAAQAVGLDLSAGGPANAACDAAAAAIEMVHAFSLVHDDLPAMDDDDLRRGRATTHIRFGEALAVLAGDALPALANERVLAVEPADLARDLGSELNRATLDMIAGQVRDTFPDQVPDAGDPLAALRATHRLKTGALLRCACRMGGHCGGASADQLSALTVFADATGLMFQVVDDLLDVTSDAATMGKATQKDAAAGKRTYPAVMGLDGARAEVGRLREAALAALSPLGPAAEPLRGLVDALATRDR